MSHDLFSKELLEQAHLEAERAAHKFEICFDRLRTGLSGNWQAVGVGSSIDFQDFRPYVAGDDLRYLDWQAYARSGQYIMKLFRAEVTPKIDLVIDYSMSMFIDQPKTKCVLELLYFIYACALKTRASFRAYAFKGEGIEALDAQDLERHQLPSLQTDKVSSPINLLPVNWRRGTLRILISDLLFAQDPQILLKSLVASDAKAVIFCPASQSEYAPDWQGNMSLIDCESKLRRRQQVTSEVMLRYQNAYAKHFTLWRSGCEKYRIPFMFMDANNQLELNLRDGPQALGVLRTCN